MDERYAGMPVVRVSKEINIEPISLCVRHGQEVCMNKKRKLFLTAVFVVVVLLIALMSFSLRTTENTGKMQVVATFYPLYFFATEIGKEKAEVSMLIPDNSDVHSWQPTISDIVKVEKAKIFIYNGAHLEPWVDDVLSAVKNRPVVVDTSAGIPIALSPDVQEMLDTAKALLSGTSAVNISTGNLPVLEVNHTQYYHITLVKNNSVYTGAFKINVDNDTENLFITVNQQANLALNDNRTIEPELALNEDNLTAYPPLKTVQIYPVSKNTTYTIEINTTSETVNLALLSLGGHEEEHVHVYDPHIWVDPLLAKAQVENILTGFVSADPSNASYYAGNAKALQQKLDELHNAFTNGLKNKTKSDIVCSHEAFNYLGKRYGFKVHAALGITADKEPSPSDLAALADLIHSMNLHYVFVEPGYPDKYMQTIANETGAQILVLDAVHGRTGEHAGMDYFQIMYENLKNLKIGLEVST